MTGPLRNGKGFLRESSNPGSKNDIFVNYYEIEKVHFLKIKPLYEVLHNDLADDDWTDPISGDDKFESLYWERILGNGMKEHHIWWRAVKSPLGPSGFFRWALKVDIQSLAVTAAEIPYKGRKAKVENADLIIRMWWFLQYDFADKLQGSLTKNFIHALKRNIIQQDIEQAKETLLKYSNKFRILTKNYLDMEEAGEQPRLFHPEGGYKDQF